MPALNKGNKGMVGQLFAAADPESCKCYSLANNFSGEKTTLDAARTVLASGHRTSLSENGGVYTVQVHSNLWYTFTKRT